MKLLHVMDCILLLSILLVAGALSPPYNVSLQFQQFDIDVHIYDGSYFTCDEFSRNIQVAWHRYVQQQDPYRPLTLFHVLSESITSTYPPFIINLVPRPNSRIAHWEIDQILHDVVWRSRDCSGFINAVHWSVRRHQFEDNHIIADGIAVGNPEIHSLSEPTYTRGIGIYHLRALAHVYRLAAASLVGPWTEWTEADPHWQFVHQVSANLPLFGIAVVPRRQDYRVHQILTRHNLRIALIMVAQKMEEDAVSGRPSGIMSASGFHCSIAQIRRDASNPESQGYAIVASIKSGQVVTNSALSLARNSTGISQGLGAPESAALNGGNAQNRDLEANDIA